MKDVTVAGGQLRCRRGECQRADPPNSNQSSPDHPSLDLLQMIKICQQKLRDTRKTLAWYLKEQERREKQWQKKTKKRAAALRARNYGLAQELASDIGADQRVVGQMKHAIPALRKGQMNLELQISVLTERLELQQMQKKDH